MKILIAPLDWGLGHATRCMPVIREFLSQGAEVELAVVKENENLLREVFPDLRQHMVPSYGIIYPENGARMGRWLLKNSFRLYSVVRQEHRIAEKLVDQQGFDLIVSDNRFGFYSSKIPSVYITHQRRIAFPPFFSPFSWIGIHWHAMVMRHFDEVWVPDLAQAPGYAGNLSHVDAAPRPITFVGPLSRFSSRPETLSDEESLTPRRPLKVVAVVSGVEPARTQFENQLRDILGKIPGYHAMILGKPSSPRRKWTEGNIDFYNHLPMAEFERVVRSASWVVSRGGYSTIMDMAVLGAKCILVPTPGQYEQVVLGETLAHAGFVVTIPAEDFCATRLEMAFQKKVALPVPPDNSLLRDAVEHAMTLNRRG